MIIDKKNIGRVPVSQCLNCGDHLNAATGVDDWADRPAPGDLTICLHCGHFMVFNDDLTFRELTNEEVVLVAGDKRLKKVQRIRELWEESKKPKRGHTSQGGA